MQHVFLSYTRSDVEFAEKVEVELESNDYSVWRDKSELSGGEVWQQQIQDALRDAWIVVVIQTPQSQKSRWVREEIAYSQQLNKPIIPLLLNDEPWFGLLQNQVIDVRDHKDDPLPEKLYNALLKYAPPVLWEEEFGQDLIEGNSIKRIEVVILLGKIAHNPRSPKGHAARSLLKDLARDQDNFVRTAAQTALSDLTQIKERKKATLDVKQESSESFPRSTFSTDLETSASEATNLHSSIANHLLQPNRTKSLRSLILAVAVGLVLIVAIAVIASMVTTYVLNNGVQPTEHTQVSTSTLQQIANNPQTATYTNTPTSTPTYTPTQTTSATSTSTFTLTASVTPTNTASSTATPTATNTQPTPTMELIVTPTMTFTDGKVISVSATIGWQSTGLSITEGSRIYIEVVDGQWSPWGSNHNKGEGDLSYVCARRNSSCPEPMPDQPIGALIGRIGDTKFLIGKRIDYMAGSSGTLYLRTNDADGGLYDNSGKLDVKVIVIKPNS